MFAPSLCLRVLSRTCDPNSQRDGQYALDSVPRRSAERRFFLSGRCLSADKMSDFCPKKSCSPKRDNIRCRPGQATCHLRGGQLDRERAALPRFALDAHFAAKGLDQVFHDRQTQARTAELARAGLVDAVKPFEHTPLVSGFDPDSGVAHGD